MTRAHRHRMARFDASVRAEGFGHLLGVDEVGRGCLAGPVVAAAVALPAGARLPGLNDSKQLTPAQRDEQALAVREVALAIAVSFVGPRTIDAINIRRASLLAMQRAVRRATVLLVRSAPAAPAAPGDNVTGAAPLLVLVDGLDAVPGVPHPQRALVRGDGTSLAIAAASVIAKTVRDGFMSRLALDYPDFGFERHKGYATEEHLDALERMGPCRWHRLSYAPCAQVRLPLA